MARCIVVPELCLNPANIWGAGPSRPAFNEPVLQGRNSVVCSCAGLLLVTYCSLSCPWSLSSWSVWSSLLNGNMARWRNTHSNSDSNSTGNSSSCSRSSNSSSKSSSNINSTRFVTERVRARARASASASARGRGRGRVRVRVSGTVPVRVGVGVGVRE